MRVECGFKQAAIVFAILIFAGSCASTPTQTGEPPSAAESSAESSVEIHFVRGRNNHRLFATFREGAAVAQSFFEHQMLAESQVDRTHYMGFLIKASEFLKAPHP